MQNRQDFRPAIEIGQDRLLIAAAMFVLGFLIVAGRLLDVAVLGGSHDEPVAKRPAGPALKTGRADIRDRNGILLATSLPVPSLYADPAEIIDPAISARMLVSVLDHLDVAQTERKLRSESRFVWIDRSLSPRQQQAVNALGVPGLHFKQEERRFYPQGRLTAHVVGFTDTDMTGLAGIEKRFDSALRDGPVTLSIDLRIQYILHEEMVRQIGAFNGIGGAGVVMNANTGEIIAMLSLPDFHPGAANAAADNARFNRASLGVYEMGSTMKVVNTALALQSGSATMDSSYDATRPIQIGRFTINDYHGKHRWMSVPEIFVYSSNVGSVKMALDFGGEVQRRFMKSLGFLEPIEVELPERGVPISPGKWSKINTMTIAFGHGLAISPLHLANGVSTIVNGGVRWPVTLLKRGADDPPVVGRQIVSMHTSAQMRRLLRLVVTDGTGRNAHVQGYVVGGKTGTAEKPKEGGRYKRNALLSSFVAAFPMHDPRYVVLVMIDEPKPNASSHGYATGGWVAAPVVQRVIARSAELLGVRPFDAQSPEIREKLEFDLKKSEGSNSLASF